MGAAASAAANRRSAHARVIRIHGKAAAVETADGRVIECIVRGKFKQGKRGQRSPLAVGDFVELESAEQGAGTDDAEYRIAAIGERRGILSRPSAHNERIEQIVAVNVDQVLITLGADSADLYLELLDRLLVAAGGATLTPVILVNKCDLVGDTASARALFAPYATLGYRVLFASAATGDGIAAVREVLAGRTTVLAGPSGAGKSSTLNAVQPGLKLRTGDVKDTGGGRHTTTHVSLLRIEGDAHGGTAHPPGYVVDTPGVREFGLWTVEKRELALFYPDFAPHLGNCRFPGCTHTHEPGCAVKAAVDSGAANRGRYDRYTRIFALLETPTTY